MILLSLWNVVSFGKRYLVASLLYAGLGLVLTSAFFPVPKGWADSCDEGNQCPPSFACCDTDCMPDSSVCCDFGDSSHCDADETCCPNPDGTLGGCCADWLDCCYKDDGTWGDCVDDDPESGLQCCVNGVAVDLCGGQVGGDCPVEGTQCCGTHAIDPATQGCCPPGSGQPFYLATQGCCGEQSVYDLQSGDLLDESGMMCCGGTTVYDPTVDCCPSGNLAACTVPSSDWSVNVSGPASMSVCQGDSPTLTFSASTDGPTSDQCYTTNSPPAWNWSVSNDSGSANASASGTNTNTGGVDTSTYTANVDTSTAGTTTYTATATPTYSFTAVGSCPTATPQSNPGNATVSVTVVGIDRIIVDGSSPEDLGPKTIAVGGSIALRAKPNPSGASFPSGKPVWSITSKPTGSTLANPAAGSATATISPDVPGTYVITAACCDASAPTAPFTVVAVQIASVTVVSGATQTNVTGAKNWAAVQSATGNVVVQATLNPNVSPVPDNLVTWTGGNAVAGQPLQRTVSLATSAKTEVTATCGGTSDYVDVWILWATITIQMTRTTPPNSAQFGVQYDGTENLGATNYASDTKAAGKVAPYAVIKPPGAGNVVTAGWSFTREKWDHNFVDAAQSPGEWDSAWINDCSLQKNLRLTPDAKDTIYDLDGPTVGDYESAVDSYEVYCNFRQHILWNLNPCSDYAAWYWEGWWKMSETPQITMKQVNTGAITLPDISGSHYKRVSGTITSGGTGLAGVSVSCGGMSATTAADGTYTIITVPPGNYVVTPTLVGYAFTPATLNVTVPNNANVTGQNFTATSQ